MVLINILHCILFMFRIFILLFINFQNKTPYHSIKLINVEAVYRIFCQIYCNKVQLFRLQVYRYQIFTVHHNIYFCDCILNEMKIIYHYHNEDIYYSLLTLFEMIKKCPLCVVQNLIFLHVYKTFDVTN